MGVADEQIRVSAAVKRTIDRCRREGESYNDALERLLLANDGGDFDDGFGSWAGDTAERVRQARQQAKARRKRRLHERTRENE